METFPLPYTFDVEKTNEFINRTVQFESGKKQKQRVSTNKLITWKINIKGDNNQRLILENFHDRMCGDATPFLFYDDNGQQVTARFIDGKLPLQLKREFTLDNPMHGNVVGFECDLIIEKVI